ncbi:hypothetical protein J3R83DRAFT_9671 [Lanmaoa asiatica]|nr:hypothetical protein J3R83DRAFT_9671 [Lanmaoa asiatica]
MDWDLVFTRAQASLVFVFCLVVPTAVRTNIRHRLPDLSEDSSEDSEVYATGYYKPYVRKFRRQLWAARSKKEHSTRVGDNNGQAENTPTHPLYPALLMVHNPTGGEWSPCTDPTIIMSNKHIAISYPAADVREKEFFVQEVRPAIVQQNFDVLA